MRSPWGAADQPRAVGAAVQLGLRGGPLVGATDGEEVRVEPDNGDREQHSKPLKHVGAQHMRQVLRNQIRTLDS